MADHNAARERATAFLRDKTTDVSVEDLPVLDECPICLDGYVQEQAVRINFDGCAHVFGRNCLMSMLTNNPRLEKRCPLCRTVWIEAPARAQSRPAHLDITAAAGPGPASILRPPRLGLPPQGMNLPGSVTLNRPRVINLIDSEEDEDPLTSFNSITRDINSVRERARNTQATRSQRKKERKQAEPTLPPPRRVNTVKKEWKNVKFQSNQQNEGEQRTPFGTSFWNPPPRRQRPLEEVIQRNWGLPNAGQYANQSAAQNAEGTRATNDEQRGRTTNTNATPLPDPRYHFAGKRRQRLQNAGQNSGQSADQNAEKTQAAAEDAIQSDATLMDVDEVETIERDEVMPTLPAFGAQDRRVTFGLGHPTRTSSLRPHNRSGPFVLSPSPESDTDANRADANHAETDRTRKEQLDQREKGLTDREQRLNDRERGLNNREQFLEGRDRALFLREQRIAQREREAGDTRLADVRNRQLQEMEAMAARHREEMRDQQ